jgi:hypothetical protein
MQTTATWLGDLMGPLDLGIQLRQGRPATGCAKHVLTRLAPGAWMTARQIRAGSRFNAQEIAARLANLRHRGLVEQKRMDNGALAWMEYRLVEAAC